MKISACILTKNEGAVIEECIRNIKPIADEIVVVDGFSKDRTIWIAKKYGCRVVRRRFSGSFSKERNFCASLASNDWVLFIDADEIFDTMMVKEIQEIKHNNAERYASYCFPRKTYFDRDSNKFYMHPVNYPAFQDRLYNRKKCRFIGIIHESLVINGVRNFIPFHIIHYPENIYKPKDKMRIKEKSSLYARLRKKHDTEKEAFIRSQRSVLRIIGNMWFYFKSMFFGLGFWKSPKGYLYIAAWFYYYSKTMK